MFKDIFYINFITRNDGLNYVNYQLCDDDFIEFFSIKFISDSYSFSTNIIKQLIIIYNSRSLPLIPNLSLCIYQDVPMCNLNSFFDHLKNQNIDLDSVEIEQIFNSVNSFYLFK